MPPTFFRYTEVMSTSLSVILYCCQCVIYFVVIVVEFARCVSLAHESFANQLRQAAEQLADDRYIDFTNSCTANDLRVHM